MNASRVWVRATDTSGHSIIWMEREYWMEARATVIRNMTTEVLNCLFSCGVPADELREDYDELDSLLRAWWDRKNSFRRRDDAVPDGYDKYRVSWKPADRECGTDECAEDETPISTRSNSWVRVKAFFQEKWANRKRSR
jgi:hypothetical protein